MNPEKEPTVGLRFKTVNENGKLVRPGIFRAMKEKGDNPETIQIMDDRHKLNIIRQKVLEEYEEFEAAEPEDQIAEAGDFLAAWELLQSSGGVDEFYSDVVGNFQRLIHDRNINLSHVELARQKRADEEGEFDPNALDVVRAVNVTDRDRLGYYDGNGQWQATGFL